MGGSICFTAHSNTPQHLQMGNKGLRCAEMTGEHHSARKKLPNLVCDRQRVLQHLQWLQVMRDITLILI